MQNINTDVFRQPKEMQDNISAILNHLYYISPNSEHIRLINTKEQELLFIRPDLGHWRMFNYIPNSFSYDNVHNKEQAYQAGLIIGKFHRHLESFPIQQLTESIPNFHCIN